MQLEKQPDATAFQALYHEALPQGIGPIENRRVENGQQIIELLRRPRLGEGHMPDVVIQIGFDRFPTGHAVFQPVQFLVEGFAHLGGAENLE